MQMMIISSDYNYITRLHLEGLPNYFVMLTKMQENANQTSPAPPGI
jgi:hypothetical protein